MNSRPYSFQFLVKPITYIFAIITGTCLILWIEKLKPSDLAPHNGLFIKDVAITARTSYPLYIANGNLSDEERKFGIIAWNYFEKNIDPGTGLSRSISNRETTNLGDLGFYLMGLISAYEIKTIDSVTFDSRIKLFFNSLSCIELNSQGLPYDNYDISTLKAVKSSKEWSGMDIGHFYNVCNKIILDYPEYKSIMKSATERWDLDNAIIKGWIYSGYQKERKTIKIQDARLGYEEYAAKNLFRAGFDVSEAIEYEDFLRFEDINDQQIAVDTRELKDKPFVSFLTPIPYILDGLENGWDIKSKELSYRIFLASKERYKKEKILTAPGEGYIDEGKDQYIYNTIYASHRPWNCFDTSGKNCDLRTVSTRIVFGWYALYQDNYSKKLLDDIKDFYETENGWYEGKYEDTGRPNKVFSAATNGLILEALNYKMNGRIIR